MSKHLFRNHDELREIFEVYAKCGGVNETARRTGIPRTTVQRFLLRFESLAQFEDEHIDAPSPLVSLKSLPHQNLETKAAYAYVLGIYLGDGHISNTPRPNVKRMMVYLDKKYPNIIQRCIDTIEIVLPNNSAKAVNRPTWVYVSCVSKYWYELMPQHGAGKKHERPIILEEWQQQIVDIFPLEFFRGLYHSDGSRSRNVVNGKLCGIEFFNFRRGLEEGY
jgi:hypothetical protein